MVTNSPEVSDYLNNPHKHLDDLQRRWLEPLGLWTHAARGVLYAFNWSLIRTLFRLQVAGTKHLPRETPFLLAPNHTSSLDPAVIAAALSYGTLCRTYWAGRKGAVLGSPLRRFGNRLVQTIPVDRDMSAVAAGAAVLTKRKNLVWFPEGTRTQNGDLQPFQSGIGWLLLHFRILAVPVLIEGAYSALPPGSRMPKLFARIRIRFGRCFDPTEWIDPALNEEEQVDLLTRELEKQFQSLTRFLTRTAGIPALPPLRGQRMLAPSADRAD